jgi:exopolyphosphatase/guanosine-5'-triphosphate,3'-diphosphate pyrophosphatase
MRAAILDFGTNTFNLLIAEKDGEGFRVLYDGKEAVKLGRGGINKKIITPEAMERGFTAISRHMKTIAEYGVQEIHAYATSAIRNAENGREFTGLIRERFGFDTHIIEGEEEAELIYRGILESVDFGDETAMIMDIGGGSIEFIICTAENMLWKHSFELGMARIIERFNISDPITESEIEEVEAYYNESLQMLFEKSEIYRPTMLAGASGTFDTLAAMARFRFNISATASSSSQNIEMHQFRELHQLLIKSTSKERLAMAGMEEVRVEMIVPATIFINFVLGRCGLKTLKQSHYALKEGVMSRLVKN